MDDGPLASEVAAVESACSAKVIGHAANGVAGDDLTAEVVAHKPADVKAATHDAGHGTGSYHKAVGPGRPPEYVPPCTSTLTRARSLMLLFSPTK